MFNCIKQSSKLNIKPKKHSKPNVTPMIGLLILCQTLNVGLLVLELSWWMISILSMSIFWQVLILKKISAQPSKVLIAALSVSGCILLAFFGRELGLLLTMIHLVCLSYVLKAFEQQKRADFYQITLLGFFVVTASLIFQQSLYYALAIVIIIIVNLMLLASAFSSAYSFKSNSKLCTKIFIQSIPVTIFLFIVFPKLSPLWEVPVAKSAKTGLSDSVKVGDIANLALSDELAFRVTFEGKAPEYSSLYWRAIVMEHFDNNSWQTKIDRSEFKNRRFNETVTYTTDGPVLNYEVIVSPTYQKWLFGLDVARINNIKTKGIEIVHRQDYTLYSVKPVTQNTSYAVSSYTQSPLALSITDYSYDKNVAIPKDSNPRLIEKAKILRQQFPNNEQLINNVLSTFNQDTYRYTLNPPKLDNNSLDEFYFDTKAGFCEHFASSFTFMMRAAGIPARLVTGYMGGEYNPEGNYYSIYQREAHAWSEVWLQGKGWVRVDPTAAINPERVERGFSPRLLQEQSDYSSSNFSLQRFRNNAWLNELRLKLEALDYNWTRWVIGYTADKQSKLLQNLMNDIASLKELKWQNIGYIFIMIIMFFIVWWLIKRTYFFNKTNDINKLYQQMMVLLTSKGISKPKGMTAQAFVSAVGNQHPEIAIEFAKFTQLYAQVEYKNLSSAEQKESYSQCVQAFITIKKQL